MRERFERALQYAKNAQELIGIFIFYVAVTGLKFGEPDLEIRYEIDEIASPLALSAAVAKPGGGTPAVAVQTAAEKLVGSENLMRIEIVNRTSSRIRAPRCSWCKATSHRVPSKSSVTTRRISRTASRSIHPTP